MRADEQVLTVAQMRAAEDALIDGGETVGSLMERAGKGAAEWVWRVAAHRPVTVLCGPGNNGGDGYVIARELRYRSMSVRVVAPLDPTSDAAIAARRAYAGPIDADSIDADRSEQADGVLVDCLFGSGLTRALSADHAALLARLSAVHGVRIAIDLPSGIASDTGEPLNPGLPGYDLTLALGAWKFAHWLMPGMADMGARRLVDIGVAPVVGAARLPGRPHLPPPPPDAHKYSRGLLAVVGGTMPGAGFLAARAAMRAGAGYVKLFAPRTSSSLAPDELVVDRRPLAQAMDDPRIGAVLVGPGLGRDEEAGARLAAVLAADRPCVLDADALVLLAPAMMDGRRTSLICTPHARELQVLCERFGIKEDGRVAMTGAIARRIGATIIGKGPDTIIAAPDGGVAVAPPAPSWLSTAGTGDVLAGIVASRLASGVEPGRAAEQAVWLHGEAARLAGPALIASDLVDALPAAWSACL